MRPIPGPHQHAVRAVNLHTVTQCTCCHVSRVTCHAPPAARPGRPPPPGPGPAGRRPDCSTAAPCRQPRPAAAAPGARPARGRLPASCSTAPATSPPRRCPARPPGPPRCGVMARVWAEVTWHVSPEREVGGSAREVRVERHVQGGRQSAVRGHGVRPGSTVRSGWGGQLIPGPGCWRGCVEVMSRPGWRGWVKVMSGPCCWRDWVEVMPGPGGWGEAEVLPAARVRRKHGVARLGWPGGTRWGCNGGTLIVWVR